MRSSWRTHRRRSAPAPDRRGRRHRRARALRRSAASPGGIGDRMSGLDQPHLPRRAGIAVPRDRESAIRSAGQSAGRRDSAAPRPRPSRRRPCRRRGSIEPPRLRAAPADAAAGIRRMRGGDRGVEQAFEKCAGRRCHPANALTVSTAEQCPPLSILPSIWNYCKSTCGADVDCHEMQSGGGSIRPLRRGIGAHCRARNVK